MKYELSEIFDSISIKHKFGKDKLIFLNTSDILDGEFLHHDYSEVKNFPGQAKKSIQKNDILYSEIRPKNRRFAKVTIDSEDYVVSTKLMVLRLKTELVDKIDLDFIYLIITSEAFINELQHIAETRSGTFPQITFSEFGRIEVEIPPYQMQKKFLKIIGAIDNKRIINKKLINSCEELSQTLFKHWFIDSEFPNEVGLPYKSSGGKMVESVLGEIPEEWEYKNLVDICEVKDGTHDSPKQVDEGYPLVTSKHLKKNNIDFSTTKLISFEDYEKVNKRSLVERYDILISMIGTVGRLYFVHDENINFAIKNIGLIKTSQITDFEYIYCYLQSESMKKYIEERMTGSTQQYISLTELRKIPVLMPNKAVLEKFKDNINYLFKMVYTKTNENQLLKDIRDSLLPKLLSGEIEIPDGSVVDSNV